MMRRIELLPASYLERRRQRRNVGLVIVAALVVLGLLIVWWVLLGFQVDEENENLLAVQQKNARLEDQIAELQRFEELETELNEKRLALSTVMTGDVDWPAILTEVAMVSPGELWFTEMTASAGITEGSTPVGTETAPVRISEEQAFARMQFNGRSLTLPGVAKFLIRLGSVKEFEAIWLNDVLGVEVTEDVVVAEFESTLEMNEKAASGRYQDLDGGIDEGP